MKTLFQCLAAVLAGIAAALLMTQLPACSSAPAAKQAAPVVAKAVPECGEIEIGMVRTPKGVYFILDEAGLQALNDRTRAIQRGECRLPELDE